MANAASGMAVDDDCKLKFLELKRKKTYRYVIFKIDESLQKIIVEKMGGPDSSYEDFTSSLPEKDCRYAVYDFDFVTEDNCQKSKIFFFAWSVSSFRFFLGTRGKGPGGRTMTCSRQCLESYRRKTMGGLRNKKTSTKGADDVSEVVVASPYYHDGVDGLNSCGSL